MVAKAACKLQKLHANQYRSIRISLASSCARSINVRIDTAWPRRFSTARSNAWRRKPSSVPCSCSSVPKASITLRNRSGIGQAGILRHGRRRYQRIQNASRSADHGAWRGCAPNPNCRTRPRQSSNSVRSPVSVMDDRSPRLAPLAPPVFAAFPPALRKPDLSWRGKCFSFTSFSTIEPKPAVQVRIANRNLGRFR